MNLIRKRLYYKPGLLLLYILGVTGLLYWALSSHAYDDPFITYRYARQLAQGHGFVYNPGERVLSTTTPLFTLILAAGWFIWPDLPHLANLIGCFSLALGGLCLWLVARTWKQPAAGWAGLLLYPTFPLLLQTLGSETPLYLAFCLGAIATYAGRRYRWTALLAALAVLTRGDGILVALVLSLHYLLMVRNRIPWAALGIFAGITAPWFLFSWLYFGSPLPATLAAKQAQGSMAISQRFAVGLGTIAKPYMNSWAYWLEAFLVILGLVYLLWRARKFGIILTWTILYFVAYSVLGVSRYFWYYAPLVPGWVALVGVGVEGVAELGRTLSGVKITAPFNVNIGHKSVILGLLVCLPFWAYQSRQAHQIGTQVDSRVAIYQSIGSWLRWNTPVSASVGALEIGIIGYYDDRRMVDFAGLIQPEVAAHLTTNATYEDTAIWAVGRYSPQYLVLYDGGFPRLDQGYVAQHCQAVQHFNGKDYNFAQNMTVYTCQ